MSNADADVFIESERALEERIGRGDPVALLFTAAWCPVGGLLAGALGHLPVDVVDVDKQRATADRLVVVSIPTLVVLRDGKERGRLLGAFSAREAEALVRRVTPEVIEVEQG